MKTTLTILLSLVFFPILAQDSTSFNSKKFQEELAVSACDCISDVKAYDRTKAEIAEQISDCITEITTTYAFGEQLSNLNGLVENAEENESGDKTVELAINADPNSSEFKNTYFEIERYLMQNCDALKEKMALNEKQTNNSMSENEEALELYFAGIDAIKEGDNKKASKLFKEAVEVDPEFAFAWDNLGLAYRKLEKYDLAIEAYNKSLRVDPNGAMPLQNIAIVYAYQKEYEKALKAYKRLSLVKEDDPEAYFGMGNIYLNMLDQYENALENLCIAYNLYIEQKSPYRTDAEHLINMVYVKMEGNGDKDRFFEILKSHGITPEE